MEVAEARRRASHMISSSMILSFTGEHVGWTTYVSRPRTFSRISQKVSPSLKRDTRASPSGVASTFAISVANAGLALPVNKQNLLTATGLFGVLAAVIGTTSRKHCGCTKGTSRARDN